MPEVLTSGTRSVAQRTRSTKAYRLKPTPSVDGVHRKPPRLRRGDTIAVLSPSAGMPYRFPHVFDNGLRVLRETLGFEVKEFPTTRASPDLLYRHPEWRARDIERAIRAPEVKAIFASIGGDDSIRVLPFLDPAVFGLKPKILMGYSDTTTLLTFANQRGWVTMHGPSIMAGISQMGEFPEAFRKHLETVLMAGPEEYEYRGYRRYSEGYPDFADPRNVGKTKPIHRDSGWHWLQGREPTRGRLFGGCFEVLVMLNGTPYWPSRKFWTGRVLFMETSEEKPPPFEVKYFLRTLGMQGVFDRIPALLFGRARGYNVQEKRELDRLVVQVVGNEFRHPEIPIVTNMDFGHTDPQFVLPLGVGVEVDPVARTIRLLESAVV